MKGRTIKFLTLLTGLVLSISLLFGCTNQQDFAAQEKIDLDETIEKSIISDFVMAHADDQYPPTEDNVSLRCYGAFDDVYVMFIDVADWMYAAVIGKEVVAGVEFVYSYAAHVMEVYSDGKFYSLSEAYKKHILSRSDLKQVQANYIADHEYLYQG